MSSNAMQAEIESLVPRYSDIVEVLLRSGADLHHVKRNLNLLSDFFPVYLVPFEHLNVSNQDVKSRILRESLVPKSFYLYISLQSQGEKY